MTLLTWLIRLIIFAFLLVFALNNAEPVTLNFLFDWSWQMPLVVLLLIFFVLGALTGLLSGLPAYWRKRREISRLKRENHRYEKEHNELTESETANRLPALPAATGQQTS